MTTIKIMANPHAGLGITPQQLTPGTPVMVAMGRLVAHINGNPCTIAWAVVRGPATEPADPTDPAGMWWLDVYAIPGGDPLPQMYRADEILGVPALGLHMHGAPDPHTGTGAPASPAGGSSNRPGSHT